MLYNYSIIMKNIFIAEHIAYPKVA